jgi:DNA-binding NarL/FixJ family response regulator
MPDIFAIHAHEKTHQVVSRAVATVPRTQLAGRSFSAVEAARVIDTLAPDVVTLDARLPDGDGIELAERFCANRPALAVILFGPTRGPMLRRAIAAGVCAYVPVADVGRTADAIRSCLDGLTSFSSRSLTGALRTDREVMLSGREREVIRLLRAGLGPGQIAIRLRVSESTVKTYVARARLKGDDDPGHVPKQR